MGLTSEAISRFGKVVAARFAAGGGEPEDLLRGPFELLVADLAASTVVRDVVLTGEHHLADERVRPDYAVYVGGALVGFAELKAPGKGVDTARYKGHDREQWRRLACLPNVLYTDGQEFALFRDGERVGEVVRLIGDVESAGASPSRVRPEAVQVMKELGIDIRFQRSKSVDEFSDQSFDYVLTVCDNARETCPVYPGHTNRLHQAFEDPAATDGSEDARLAAFRRVRDQLRSWLGDLAQKV